MSTELTRRRFLGAVGTGAAWIALSNVPGCGPAGRTLKSSSFAQAEPVMAFRSRPDLSPPAIDVVTQAHDTAPGYIFLAPKKGPGQDGLMIIDNLGQPVWFSKGKYALDFKVQYYQGKPVLTWWEGEPYPRPSVGEFVILDSSYQEITRVQAGNGYEANHHEFFITSEDTALIPIYGAVRRDLSPLGGQQNAIVYEGVVQEVDIETGEVLFEWHSLEHVSPDESYRKPTYSSYFDYFHINAIDVDHDNNLIITARNTFAVYKVDRKSGEVMWRLGGKWSDFEMGPGTRTAWHHDARRQPDGTITIFDNGAGPQVHEQSRGIMLELDEDNMTATLVRVYTSPDKLLAISQGNMQVLPNGNAFVGWGSEPFLSEFSHEGKLLLNAHFPSDNESYRAFRFPWSAHPSDQPAAVAERTSKEVVRLYASWNGATEVASWEVLAGQRPGQLESVGSVPRDGFETAMLVQTSEPYVAVRANHHLGRVLGTTATVKL